MCSISTFGQGGPLANRPGYDFIGCAYSGVLSMIGERDGAPCLPGVGVGDVTTGVHALSAIMAALLHRERTGEGQYVETSLLDCYFSYNDMPVHNPTYRYRHGTWLLRSTSDTREHRRELRKGRIDRGLLRAGSVRARSDTRNGEVLRNEVTSWRR